MKQNNKLFSHQLLAEKIANIFHQNRNNSFVISINGSWGTGKTHLVNEVLKYLDSDNYIKVNFNAWTYYKKEDIWRALLVCIIDTCREYISNQKNRDYLGWNDEDIKILKQLLDDTERALYTAFVKEIPGEICIDTSNLLKTGINMALKFVPWGNFGCDLLTKLLCKKEEENSIIEKDDVEQLWGIFTRSSTQRSIEKIVGVEQFRENFEKLLLAILVGEYEDDKNKLNKHNRNIKLVVAIDDLDRCLPENVLEVLEAIKLFVDYSNTYFMIAMDSSIIQQGLNIRYSGNLNICAKEYCEKMIDLSFNIPYILENKFSLYIQELSEYSEIYIELFSVLNIALKSNLRAWERYIYRADFYRNILETLENSNLFEDIKLLKTFLKLQCFSYQWPEIYKKIYKADTYIFIEESMKKIVDFSKKEMKDIIEVLRKESISEELISMINNREVLDFINTEPYVNDVEDKEKVQLIFTLDKFVGNVEE